MGMNVGLPLVLLAVSLFLFGCIPLFISLLKDSQEAQSLRGQAKLNALVQTAPMAVVATDKHGRITSWNPAAEQIFGWTEKEILGTFGMTWVEERKKEQLRLQERTFKGQVTKGFESERINRSGKRFPVSISAAPLRDQQGQITGIMAIIEDISEGKQIERELHEKTVTLCAVTDALNSFLESGNWAAASKVLLTQALNATRSECGLLAVAIDGPNLLVVAQEGAEWHTEEKAANCTKRN